ncbi:hypothetical protein ACFY2N_16405 [Streptomyces rubiginosohelvolus]|uniref:hypothetical protein n=1 Tax=Streptomyces TaxID=1883 RepID=UPI000BEFE1EB|nr:hypothetical protein [Streptomyces sp. st170]
MTSLIISIIALCVSISNVAWQLARYLLEGPRIRVRLKVGALGRDNLVSMPVENVKNLNETFASLESRGFTQPVLVVEVVNHGRLGVQLLDFGVDVPKGLSLKVVENIITDTPMPYVLEPHQEARWAVPFEYVANFAMACKETWPSEAHPLRAYVHRAGGKKIRSAQSLP